MENSGYQYIDPVVRTSRKYFKKEELMEPKPYQPKIMQNPFGRGAAFYMFTTANQKTKQKPDQPMIGFDF